MTLENTYGPWKMQELRASTLKAVENQWTYNLQFTLQIHSSISMDSTSLRSCRTIIFTMKKKSMLVELCSSNPHCSRINCVCVYIYMQWKVDFNMEKNSEGTTEIIKVWEIDNNKPEEWCHWKEMQVFLEGGRLWCLRHVALGSWRAGFETLHFYLWSIWLQALVILFLF